MKASFKRVSERDLRELNRIVNDPQVCKHLALVPPVSLASTRKFYEGSRKGNNRWFGIWVEDELVGSCSMHPGNKASKTEHCIEFGLCIDKEHWGRGLGDAAMKHMLGVARWMNLRRVELHVEKRNTRAQALYEKHGFKLEGVKKKAIKTNNRYYDLHLMARLL